MGTTEIKPIDDQELQQLRDLLALATRPGTWHWSGNMDTGEPYLACWVPGAGRCTILAIGHRERSTTGRAANEYREHLRDSEMSPEEIRQAVIDWTLDPFGSPIKEPELWLFHDLMATPARDRAIYEVAPTATRRDDPKVYRADITGLRHPDAELIVKAINLLPSLIVRLEQAEQKLSEHDE